MAKREIVTAFVASAGALAALEAAAWGVLPRPLSAHEEMSPWVRIVSVAVNAVPHAIAAFQPMTSIGWYLPYATFFVSAQASNWWWPYLAGIQGRGTATLFNRDCVRNSKKILPPLADRPAPSGEHTVCIGLSAAALGLAINIFNAQRPAIRLAIANDRITLTVSALAGALALGGVLREANIAFRLWRARTSGETMDTKEMPIDPLPFLHAAAVGGYLYWMYHDKKIVF